MSGSSNNRFSEILRSEREKRQMTLEQMAELLGTTKQVLSRYERGERNPKLVTAAIFAQRLGIPISAFENDVDWSNVKSTQIPLSKEQQEEISRRMLLDKYSDVIGILESLPDSYKDQAVSYLRFLSIEADNK